MRVHNWDLKTCGGSLVSIRTSAKVSLLHLTDTGIGPVPVMSDVVGERKKEVNVGAFDC